MRRIWAAVLAAVMLLTTAGCGVQPAEDNGKLRVVCTLFPYYDFVRQIGGEDAEAVLLVPAGRETHSFEPTPVDVITMSRADVFVYNGGESEQWVEAVLDAAGEDIPYRLKMMDQVDVYEEEFTEGMQGAEDHDHGHDHDHDHGDEDAAHDHEDEHDHDHHEDSLQDGHEEDIGYDEHIWTSPVKAMALCRALCDVLCQADPDHEANYRARLETYLQELETLDGTFREIVDGGQRQLLVFGDRFPLLYFCKEYGLDYRAAFHGCAGDTEPSLATMKYLIDLVRAQEIPVVYTIELSSQKIAQAVAETTGAAVRTFHSCQTVSRAELDRGETYISLMTANAEVLREGLS